MEIYETLTAGGTDENRTCSKTLHATSANAMVRGAEGDAWALCDGKDAGERGDEPGDRTRGEDLSCETARRGVGHVALCDGDGGPSESTEFMPTVTRESEKSLEALPYYYPTLHQGAGGRRGEQGSR